MCFSLMLYTMVYQLVGCYGSLNGTSAIRSHLVTCMNILPDGKATTRRLWSRFAEKQHDLFLVGDLSTQPPWVLTSTLRGPLFVQSLAAESEPVKAMG